MKTKILIILLSLFLLSINNESLTGRRRSKKVNLKATQKWLNKLKKDGRTVMYIEDFSIESLKKADRLYIAGSFFVSEPPKINFVYLKALKNLKELEIVGFSIRDRDLIHLTALKKLEILNIGGTVSSITKPYKKKFYNLKITNRGLAYIKRLKNLATLDISYALNVSNAGLVHLKALKKLKELNLKGTKVTDKGIKKLNKALPKCNVSN